MSSVVNLISEYTVPLAVATVGTVVTYAASKLMGTSKVDEVASDTISKADLTKDSQRRQEPTLEKEGVTLGSDRVPDKVTKTLGNETLRATHQSTVRRVPQATMQATSKNTGKETLHAVALQEKLNAVPMEPLDTEFDEDNYQKYISGNKAQVAFSTAAGIENGVARNVELTKEEKEKKVPDEDRQKKVDVQFAKLKHMLGLGGRAEGSPFNKKISYSCTWHFVEVFQTNGEAPIRYDLTKKDDIQKLLEDQFVSGANDSGKIDKIYADLLTINREVNKLTEHEAGKTEPCFLQDYMGNPNGPMPFASSPTAIQVQNRVEKGKFKERLHGVTGMATDGKLTSQGVIAFNRMDHAMHLQRTMFENLQSEITPKQKYLEELRKKDQTQQVKDDIKKSTIAIQELERAKNQILNADLTVINHLLIELSREVKISEPKWDVTEQRFKMVEKTLKGTDFLRDLTLSERLEILGPAEKDEPRKIDEALKRRQDYMANIIVNNYGVMVSRESGRSRFTFGLMDKMNPMKEEDKVHAIEVGALFYHLVSGSNRIGVLEGTQRLNRAETLSRPEQATGFLDKRTRGVTFQEPKGEKLLISAVLGNIDSTVGNKDLNGYTHASDDVRAVLKTSIVKSRSQQIARGKVYFEGYKPGEKPPPPKPPSIGREFFGPEYFNPGMYGFGHPYML